MHTVGASDKGCPPEGPGPGGFLYLMRAVAAPVADPQLELRWLPDPGSLIQCFLVQCHRRTTTISRRGRGRGATAKTTAGALDKKTLDKGSRVWRPAELQLWIGHGHRHRPHQIRNHPGSEASWAHSLSNFSHRRGEKHIGRSASCGRTLELPLELPASLRAAAASSLRCMR